MRRNAIARIIIFSILILVLLWALLVGLGFSLFTANVTSDSYTLTEEAVVFDPSSVSKLEIQWVAGDVHVKVGSTEQIRVYEEYHGSTEAMRVNHSGSTLKIQFQKATWGIGAFHTAEKDLTVIVPEDWHCQELDIETVSGHVIVENLIAQALEVEGVSAECTLSGCYADRVSLSTVSGNVSYQGSLNTFDCESISARCDLTLTAKASQIDVESVSGSIYLHVAKDFGFALDLDTASGSLHSQYDAAQQNGRYVYGDEACQIDASTISGSVHIKKAE